MRLSPDRTLLILASLLVVPASGAIVWNGSALAWAVISLLALLALIDAFRASNRLQGVRLEVEPVVRATRGVAFPVELRFSNEGAALTELRAGLQLPPDLRSTESPIVESDKPLPAGSVARLTLELTPLRRGQFDVEACHIETGSAWKLWRVRRRLPLEMEVRSYPDLRSDRRKLSALFLRRGADGSQVLRQIGKGREFEKLREYQAGDDFGDIDWKATSRRGMPITRTYQIERTQEVYVVVDHSRLSGRELSRSAVLETGGGGNNGEYWNRPAAEHEHRHEGVAESIIDTQLEAFLKSALVLASVAQMQGDLFGFVGFSDRVERFVRSRSGAQHYQLVRDSLFTMTPSPVAPDFEELMVQLSQRLTRRALLVMLVDLSDPLTAESFCEAVPILARQHVVLVNMVRPRLAHPLFSRSQLPDDLDLHGVYERLGGHLQWRDLRETANKLSRLGVELALPDQAELSAEVVSQYLKVKRRQLL